MPVNNIEGARTENKKEGILHACYKLNSRKEALNKTGKDNKKNNNENVLLNDKISFRSVFSKEKKLNQMNFFFTFS